MTPEALDKIQNMLKESGLLEQILRREQINNLIGLCLLIFLQVVGLLLVKRFRCIEDDDARKMCVLLAGVFSVGMMVGILMVVGDLVSIYTAPIATAAKFLLCK